MVLKHSPESIRRKDRDTMQRSAMRSRGGFSLIELLIVLVVIATIASIALPNYQIAKQTANESSAISSMRALAVAEANYRVAHNATKYGRLSELHAAELVNPKLGDGSKSGYTFITYGEPGADTFAFTAIPADPASRRFFIDQSSIVRASATDEIGVTSSPIK